MTEAERLKHLEFIQAVITRQAGNQFLIKGWALTVAAAFYSFAASKHNWLVAVVAIGATLSFTWLDGYFLRQERLFRCLWTAVVPEGSTVARFSMSTQPYEGDATTRYRYVFRSKPLWALYGAMVAVGIFVAIAASYHVGVPSSAHA